MRRVAVYYNLHQECWSIQSRETGSDDYGKVIAHEKEVLLADATYVVRQTGRKKVIAEQRKNVHAFVVGYWIPTKVINLIQKKHRAVYYNPYKVEHFQIGKGKITSSEISYLNDQRKVFAIGELT